MSLKRPIYEDLRDAIEPKAIWNLAEVIEDRQCFKKNTQLENLMES